MVAGLGRSSAAPLRKLVANPYAVKAAARPPHSKKSGRRHLEQSVQDGFLHVHAIFGLVQDYGVRAIQNFRSYFEAAMGWEAVHEDGFRRGVRHQFGIDLIGLEDGVADFAFFFEAHAGPGIGVDALRAGHGFARIGH